MKEWQKPEVIDLDVNYTQGDTTGSSEDHIKVANPQGYDIYGSKS